jgi:hypothetical protein
MLYTVMSEIYGVYNSHLPAVTESPCLEGSDPTLKIMSSRFDFCLWVFYSDIGGNFFLAKGTVSYSDIGLDTKSIFKSIALAEERNFRAVR